MQLLSCNLITRPKCALDPCTIFFRMFLDFRDKSLNLLKRDGTIGQKREHRCCSAYNSQNTKFAFDDIWLCKVILIFSHVFTWPICLLGNENKNDNCVMKKHL